MYTTVNRSALFLFIGIFMSLIPGQQLIAQFEHHVVGARPASLGGSGMLLKNDPWGASVNPAMYVSIKDISVSAAYIPGRFALPELGSSAATVVFPLRIIPLAIAVHRFGSDLYSETTISVSGARSVGDRLSVGATMNWYHLSIERYGTAATVGLTAGIRAEITGNLSTGFVVSNLNRPSVGQGKNTLPQMIRAGLLYRPHPLIKIAAEIEKDVLFEPEFRFGVEYFLTEYFFIRAGMNDRPTRAAGGFSVLAGNLQLDYALQWHFELGQTHYFTLTFTLPSGGKKRPAEPTVTDSQIDIRPSITIEQLLVQSEVEPRISDPFTESLLIYINHAAETELMALPGIGRVMAQRIISFRENQGAFQKIEDFRKVQGIGEKTIENIIMYWHERYRSLDK
jgi:competence ComEA-like helix-hairpin-helix protein